MLDDVVDPIPFLQVLAHRWRTGEIAPCGQAVRFRTVENADRRLSVRALTNNLLQTVRRYGTSQCGQDRDEFTYELTGITKVSTQWYIGINILATSVL